MPKLIYGIVLLFLGAFPHQDNSILAICAKTNMHIVDNWKCGHDQILRSSHALLQALNGFLMILDCQGELFFATHSIETYLGFHQVRKLLEF